jgi:hypothetical protein
METFLLDKESQFILKMISQLSENLNQPISFKELETELGISKQTIKTYLDSLLTYCRHRNLQTFTMTDKQVTMSGQTDFNIFDLYHHMTQQSVKYQIMTTIFHHPEISFTELYLDLALSKTCCYSHIKQLNDLFKPYHCHINFLQKHPIHGEHHQIRFLYYNLFWGLKIDDIIPETPNLDALLKRLLDFHPKMMQSTLYKLKLAYYIFQVSSQSGYSISPEVDFRVADSPYLSYADFWDILMTSHFLDVCPDEATQAREARYLYFMFCNINLIPLKAFDTAPLPVSFSKSPDVIYFIDHLQSKLPFNLTGNDLKFLNYNLALLNQEARLFRGRNRTFGLENMAAHIDDAKHFSSLVKEFMQEICQDNQMIQSLIQNFPILYYQYVLLLWTIIEKHRQPINLFVQTNLSPIYQEVLRAQIVNTTSCPIKIYTLNESSDVKPDGIISDWLPDERYRDVPFFSTSLFYVSWNQSELDYFLNYLIDRRNHL